MSEKPITQRIKDRLAAYTAMLEHGGVQVRPAQVVRVQALASSVHSVLEQVRVVLPDGAREALVNATNVYHKTPRGWRLVAHHASTGGSPDNLPGPEVPQVLH